MTNFGRFIGSAGAFFIIKTYNENEKIQILLSRFSYDHFDELHYKAK